MIDKALTAGLAGLWAWTVLNDDKGILRGINAELDKRTTWRKWMECPWCSGAWFAGLASLLLGYRPSAKLVTAGAAAGVTGLIGSYLEGA
jgi:hypothetical protein